MSLEIPKDFVAVQFVCRNQSWLQAKDRRRTCQLKLAPAPSSGHAQSRAKHDDRNGQDERVADCIDHQLYGLPDAHYLSEHDSSTNIRSRPPSDIC